MKRIVSLAVISALLLGAGLAVYHFSGARGKVVKKNIEDKIDDLLGRDKVRLQELADDLAKANEAVEIYFNGRVESQVDLERQVRNFKPIKARYEASGQKLDKTIAAVEMVTKDPTVEVSLNGDTKYSQKNMDELQALLAKQTDQHKADKAEYNLAEKNLKETEKSLTSFRDKEQDARKKVALFEARKKALDKKLSDLAKQKEAAKLLKGDKASPEANFDAIEKKLSELEDSAEVETRKGEERAAINAEKAQQSSKGGATIGDALEAAREARGQK